MFAILLLIVLIVLFFTVLPVWPHSKKWGYGPGGIAGLVLVIVLILLLLGRV
ncbi:MAG: DUF3309 family protein [bacterium]